MKLKYQSTLALLLATFIPIGLVAPAHAAATSRYNITFDCDLGEENEDDHSIAEGDVLKIRLVDCDGIGISEDDDLGNSFLPGNVELTSSDVLISGDNVVVTVYGQPTVGSVRAADLSVGEDDIDVFIAGSAQDPTSTLLDTRDIRMNLDAPDMMIREEMIGSLTGDAGDGDVYVGANPACEVEPGLHVLKSVDFVVETSGDYDFRVVDTAPMDEDLYWGVAKNPSGDSFLALYSDFDPANPDSNVVGCNDDGIQTDIDEIDLSWHVNRDPAGTTYDSIVTESDQMLDRQWPWFRALDLEPGTYSLVYMYYRAISSEEFNSGVDTSPVIDGYSWTPRAQTITVEVWGPNGGIESDEDLAPTGGVDSTIALWAGLAIIGVGVAVGAGRRREARV